MGDAGIEDSQGISEETVFVIAGEPSSVPSNHYFPAQPNLMRPFVKSRPFLQIEGRADAESGQYFVLVALPMAVRPFPARHSSSLSP